MTTIDIKFLGIPSINISNNPIQLSFLKAECIMYLLFYQKEISRDTLSSLLWGDMDQQSARKNLRNAIYIIRKDTFDDIIVSPKRYILQLNEKYEINSDVDLLNSFSPCEDLDNETIEEFINSYDGSFLEELKYKSTPEFGEWIDTISIKLSNTYRNNLKRLINRLVDEKEFYYGEMCCRKLIELEEYEEIGYSNLMKLYLEQKKYEDAINIYNTLVEKLYEDLSVKPSKETERIYEKVINDMKIKKYKNSSYFYGREDEKKTLYNNIYNFVGSKPFKSFLVCGEDGIGKSLLLDEVINDFDINIFVIKINCYEYEKGFIFKFWDKVFQQISNSIREKKLDIPRDLIKNISKSFPTLDIEANHNVEDYNISNYSLTEKAIFDLFTFLSDRLKLMFVVDDLHFADQASLELLYKTILANRYKIMLIASSRDENENIHDKFYYSLKYNNAIEKIYLSRFSKLETRDFINQIIPEALPNIDKIYSESEGNPLFIIEMVNNFKNGNVEDYMTNKIENLIKGRLINLSHEANKLLSICSLFHDIFYVEMLSTITNIEGMVLIDIIEELLSKGILKEEIDMDKRVGLVFTHRKIREYIYDDISKSKQIILHTKIAEYYELELKDDKRINRTLYPEMIYHFTSSNNRLKLFKYKIKWLEDILKGRHEIFPVEKINESVGLIQYYVDEDSLEKEFEGIKALYEELMCCHNDQIIEEEIIFLYLYGRFNKNRGNHEESLSYLNKMVYLSRENKYYEHALNGHLQLIHYYVNINNKSLMGKSIEDAEEIAKILEDERMMAIVWRFKGYFYFLSGKYEDGESYIEKAMEIFTSPINKDRYLLNIVASLFYLGENYRMQGLYDKALEYYYKALELCDDNEDCSAAALIFSKIGYVKYVQGITDEAQFYLLKSLKAYDKTIFAWGRADVCYYLFKIYESKNMMVKARTYIEQAYKYIERYTSEELIDDIYSIINSRN